MLVDFMLFTPAELTKESVSRTFSVSGVGVSRVKVWESLNLILIKQVEPMPVAEYVRFSRVLRRLGAKHRDDCGAWVLKV